HHVEITAETPHVEKVIETAVKNVDKSIQVGAGTVLDPETARTVILAGASFIVSPTLNTKTLEICGRYGIEHIPGILNKTENLTAYVNCVSIVKYLSTEVIVSLYLIEY